MNRSVSSDSPRQSECRDYARLLGAYVDGELEASKLLEIEGHVASCEGCRERVALDRAMRGTLKKVVKESAQPDRAAMRARMAGAMTAERARGEAREATERSSANVVSGIFGWRTMLPLTSAAALAVLWGSVHPLSTSRSSRDGAMRAGMVDDPLAELVWNHAQPLPPERTDEQGVRAFERYVGVPVRPAQFERGGAHLVGARLLPVQHEHAAMLEYRVGQGPSAQRVSVFIYDPRKIQVGGPELTPRAVGTAQVRVGRASGYSVAVAERDGVGYTLASDLDPDRSAELIGDAE
jgi:anti-sigma factor RsiW